MNNLKDIKSIVTVPDDSLIYLLIAMTGLVLVGFFYLESDQNKAK